MMSIEQIVYENREAENRAKQNRVKLFVAQTNSDQNVTSAPNIGDYRPKGWELVETYFVDSSGMGGQNEPTLTFNQFLQEVKQGYGYAIISEGQFQVYIGEFKEV